MIRPMASYFLITPGGCPKRDSETMVPWTLKLFSREFRNMTFGSIWRYRNAVIQRKRSPDQVVPVRLDFRDPAWRNVWIRVGSSDECTLDEIRKRDVYGAAATLSKNVGTVIDLGANIGLASRYFLAKFPSASVFAVEPDSSNFELLTRNLSVTPESRRSCVQAAVWNANEMISLNPPVDDSRFNAIQVRSGKSDRMVQGWTMAKLIELSGFKTVDILKIDIEGAETQLFQGDLDWLDRVGMILIEFHGNSRAESNFDHLVEKHGLAIVANGAHTTIAVRTADGSK